MGGQSMIPFVFFLLSYMGLYVVVWEVIGKE